MTRLHLIKYLKLLFDDGLHRLERRLHDLVWRDFVRRNLELFFDCIAESYADLGIHVNNSDTVIDSRLKILRRITSTRKIGSRKS